LRVLREKFLWPPYDIHAARQRIDRTTVLVHPRRRLDVVKRDPDDDRILECAAEAGSEFIVTEDKDLLDLVVFGNAKIVKARRFIELIEVG
jgi:predicted nucleic acid-binding protein